MKRLVRLARATVLYHLYDQRVIWFCWQCDATKPFWHKHPHHCYVIESPPLTIDRHAGSESAGVRDE